MQSALTDIRSHVTFWAVSLCMLVADLWSKQWAFAALSPNEQRTFIPAVINFRRSLNDGAVFGSFTGMTGLFIVASVVALIIVVYLFAHSSPSRRLLHVSLGLILAGALGNLYDRAFIKADVVRHETENGEVVSIIGRVVSEPDSETVEIGQWPEGTQTARFDADAVELRRQGVVRDFIKFTPTFPKGIPKVGGHDIWPWVFNIADASLVCGVLLMMANLWLSPNEPDGAG